MYHKPAFQQMIHDKNSRRQAIFFQKLTISSELFPLTPWHKPFLTNGVTKFFSSNLSYQFLEKKNVIIPNIHRMATISRKGSPVDILSRTGSADLGFPGLMH